MSEAISKQIPAKISRRLFDALPDYSFTVPTSVTIGKRWKRREPYAGASGSSQCPPGACACHRWFMGEYVPDPVKNGAYILWTEIVVEPPG